MTFAVTRAGPVPAPSQPAMCSEASTDEALIARVAHGDRLAMQTLFARHQTRVHRFVLRLVRNEATAEDVVSDVFLDVWRTASQFQARSAVSTWLLAIARLKTLSLMRRRIAQELPPNFDDTRPDPADDPEMALQHKHEAAMLQQGLAQLSTAHAEVIDRVYYHGKSIRKVADITCTSEATVKTRMFYARKHLRELVGNNVSKSHGSDFGGDRCAVPARFS